MKKIIILAAACAVASFATAAESAAAAEEKPLKVLMIGNSFSICNLKEMPPIAKSMGLKLDLGSLYIPGCSLKRHWNNVVASTNAAFKPYRFDRTADGKAEVSDGRANIPDALAMEKWDVVTVQQASHDSWNPSTFQPEGDRLVAKIRELAPQAKIVVQETWSYPPWDRRLGKYGFDQVEMYARLRAAYAAFAKRHALEVIPAGTAAEFVDDRNQLFTSPDFHFNRQGQYLQGLVWTAKLFGADVRKCEYRPDWLDDGRAKVLRAAAMDAVEGARVRRAFRDARVTRGNTNILKVQPVDDASWLWLPGAANDRFCFVKFRNEFEVAEGAAPLVFDVSADERFVLLLDGEFVARGPNRGTVENWQYQTYVADLKPGRHVFEAYVQVIGDSAPLAQLSYRGGFVFKANGQFDAKLTTGKGAWTVGRISGIRPAGKDGGAWGGGDQFEITGCGPYSGEPAEWTKPEVVRGPAGVPGPFIYGIRTTGWMLFPSQLPDQTEIRCTPGRVKAVARGTEFRRPHVYTEDEAKETVDLSKPFTVPARTKMQLAWDLGNYYCAYPDVVLSGGKGAKFSTTRSSAAT